ncbi:hypothetical protein LA080_002179 [Diaporthe eres]|uniref:Rhodopsin domain-containing protein n=2 Tax=Diaporthe vaccinii TaxID=105482 RepID=A0ABR4ECR4_9PEZI|nr:hypothetical protein LA080_002179 [Diaporthe eres]
MISPRGSFKDNVVLVDPTNEVNAGLWSLFATTTVFLAARLWCKITRRNGLWWDDHILIFSWLIVLFNDILISVEFGTGYVTKGEWDDRMHILINISSCGTLVGQAISKTAFAVSLLRMTERWQQYILWFIIVTMNAYMFTKVLFQWARQCDDTDYDVWYRPNYCVDSNFLDKFKEGGNIYNILMDFVLALFPWAITMKLRMRKYEKVGLALTMSLGMLVAIMSAVRTWWVGRDVYGDKDALYFWRRSVSMIWFSAEITGTIIVQCIPVLRPFLQEVHAAISSRTFGHSSSNAKTIVSQNKFDPSAGTYSVTVTTIAAEKAAQKGSNVDTFGTRGRVSQEFQPQPSPRGPSEEFELPIQKTSSGWSPVNSRE